MKKYGNGILLDMTEEEIAEANARQKEYDDDANNRNLRLIKDIRQDKLLETDWWVLRGNITDAQSQYRQKLRDIPADYDSSKYDELLARDSDGKLTHSVWSKP
tara:strand:- start:173 stop:481 length:309 start_codon:yes stop_codon:yes gene_type:complete